MSIFDKFKLGLSKSSKNLSSGLNDLIFKKKIEENELNQLEDFLIQSDVGVEVASELKKKFSSTKIDPKKNNKNQVFEIFSDHILEILKPLEKNLESLSKNKPCVILVAGVNGVGKTTTIGKLGKILGKDNKKVLFGAADTFRAAAVSQLESWAKKINAQIIKSDEEWKEILSKEEYYVTRKKGTEPAFSGKAFDIAPKTACATLNPPNPLAATGAGCFGLT